MSLSEKQQLKALYVATALYFGSTVPDDVLLMYVEDLEDLSFTDVAEALKTIRRDPSTRRAPLPAQIREKICPEVSPKEDAREASARIVAAISKHGWNNAERAKEYIGDLGWEVVMLQGGWLTVCQKAADEMGICQAQWRDLAESISAKTKRGDWNRNQGPALPMPTMRSMPASEDDAKIAILTAQLKQIQDGGPDADQTR